MATVKQHLIEYSLIFSVTVSKAYLDCRSLEKWPIWFQFRQSASLRIARCVLFKISLVEVVMKNTFTITFYNTDLNGRNEISRLNLRVRYSKAFWEIEQPN